MIGWAKKPSGVLDVSKGRSPADRSEPGFHESSSKGAARLVKGGV
jgi:hypothetical protein